MALSTIEEAIEALRRGSMVVVVDDEDRENEGDLIMAAEDVTSDNMAWSTPRVFFVCRLNRSALMSWTYHLWWLQIPRPNERRSR